MPVIPPMEENNQPKKLRTTDSLLATLTPYNLIRLILTLLCVILFVLQSFGEMEKFFSNMTSVSIRTEEDLKVPKPTIVVCLKEPFKMGRYPETMEEYRNLTYSFGEVFARVRPGESEGLKGRYSYDARTGRGRGREGEPGASN